MRCHTSKSGEEQIMQPRVCGQHEEGRNNMFYITGESVTAVSSPPILENLREKGYEVLYMVDPIDEHAVQQLKECDGNKFKSVTKEGLDIDDDDEKKKTMQEMVMEDSYAETILQFLAE